MDAICDYPKEAIIAKARRYGGRWCHMWCDGNVDELHAMAEKIGLKRDHFQDIERFPHYDLVESKRKLAIENGAQETSLRSWIRKQKKLEKK